MKESVKTPFTCVRRRCRKLPVSLVTEFRESLYPDLMGGLFGGSICLHYLLLLSLDLPNYVLPLLTPSNVGVLVDVYTPGVKQGNKKENIQRKSRQGSITVENVLFTSVHHISYLI